MDVDPSHPGAIMVCGTRNVPERNAAQGYVYLSTDYGATWRQVLVDSSTAWVSEESCAFGPDGTAYFLASSSAVFHGLTHHQLGRSRLHRSSDGGLTWHVMTSSPFVDYSSLAVDATQAARRGDVYVFANVVYVNDPNSGPGLLSIPAGDTAFARPVMMTGNGLQERLIGATPTGSVVLDNGTALAMFHIVRSSAPGSKPWLQRNLLYSRVEAVRSRDGGRTLDSAIAVSDSEAIRQLGEPTIAVDRSHSRYHNRVYASWAENAAAHTHIVLATSDDDGVTWRRRRVETLPGPPDSLGTVLVPGLTPPAVAVNRDGVVGLFWIEHHGRCPRFAASRSGGDVFEASVPAIRCDMSPSSDVAWYEDYLFAWPESEANPQGAERDEMRVGVRIQMNVYSLMQTSMVTDDQGRFHPMWPALRQGESQLWTTTIAVGLTPTGNHVPVDQLADITPSAALEFTNDQYDAHTHTFSVDVRLVNRDTVTLTGPFLLQPTRIRSSLGTVVRRDEEAAGKPACRSTAGSYLINDDTLASNGHSAPVRVGVTVHDVPRTDAGEIDILLRVCGRRRRAQDESPS